jgi:nitric oxide reductase activation protein
MAENAETVFRETFTLGVQTKLDALMFGVRRCQSTLEVQALARSIAQMLDDETRAETEPNPENQDEQAATSAEDSSPLRQALDAGLEDHVSGIGELAQAAIDAKCREAPALNLPMPCAATSSVARPLAEGASFSAEVRAATNALRQRLAGMLQAETLCRRYPAVSGKRIDTRRLCRIDAGDARIFVRDVTGLKTDTAVQILVDRSGSMGSSRNRGKSAAVRPIEVARASCYATALALKQVPGVTVAAAAFPGNQDGEVIVMSRFEERVDRQAARFASLEANGGTPMAEAMLWGAARLLEQPQPRRILLVTTDGAYDEALGQAMAARLQRAGIEALGIGIHCDVSHLFARSRQIATIADLPQAMFEVLLDAIQRPVFTNRDDSAKRHLDG